MALDRLVVRINGDKEERRAIARGATAEAFHQGASDPQGA